MRLAIRVKVDPLRYELWEQARNKVAALAGEEVSESDAFASIVEEFVKRPAEGESSGSGSGGSAFRVVVEPAAAAQEPKRAEGRAGAPHAGPGIAPSKVVTFETLPSEAPAGFWPAHAHLFSWNDRSGGLAFSEGIPAIPGPGGAHAPPPVPGHRPQILADVIGQECLVASLRLAIKAAAIRGKPVPHLLLSGGPGLGKTSLARAMAAEIGKAVHLTFGPALADPATLVGLLARARAGDVVFVDEIQALPRPVAEMLYEAMEDRRISLPVTQGVASRTLTLELQPFTLAGATTEPDRVPAPLRSRFGLVLELEPYPIEDLARMTERAVNAEQLAIDPAAAMLLAGVAHGTPREVLTLVARAVDLGVARTRHRIDLALAAETLRGLGIDHRGLGPIHRRVLAALAAIGSRALSQSRLALAAAVSPRALREIYEPGLIRLGLIDITPRGRRLASGFACSP